MNLCSSGHDEVCYEGNKCPVCDLIGIHKDEVNDMEKGIAEKNTEITDLEKQVEKLEDEVAELTPDDSDPT